MNALKTPLITDIERFSVKNGNGIRMTVFLKGCPLRCRWCHNPETILPTRQLLYHATKCIGCGACAAVCPKGCHTEKLTFNRTNCINCMQCAKVCPTGALTPSGYRLSPQELASRLMRDLPFYGSSGGVTFSGGEPLLYPRYIAACTRLLHVPTRYIDTCGAVPPEHIYLIKPYTDLLLFDIKDTDGERLRRNTGADLDVILRNLAYADDLGIPTRLRLPIIAGINDNEVHILAVRNLLRRLRHCTGADILPYHPYMASKYNALGLVCDILSDSYIPKTETLARLREILDN